MSGAQYNSQDPEPTKPQTIVPNINQGDILAQRTWNKRLFLTRDQNRNVIKGIISNGSPKRAIYQNTPRGKLLGPSVRRNPGSLSNREALNCTSMCT